MNKDDFIKYLHDFLNYDGIKPKTKSLLKTLIRKIKSIDDFSYCQFLEIISMYCDNLNTEIQNMINEKISSNEDVDKESNLSDKDILSDDAKKIEELLDSLYESAEKLGIDIKMAQLDPSTGTVRTMDGRYIPVNDIQNSDFDQQIQSDDIKYIPRRTLAITVTRSGFRINESFMQYLKEINELKRPNKFINPYREDDDDEELDLGITIGFKKDSNEMVITVIGGVSEYETFMIDELTDDTGKMSDFDFKYFRSQISDEMYGIYTFELDKCRKYFTGKKLLIVNNDLQNKGE